MTKMTAPRMRFTHHGLPVTRRMLRLGGCCSRESYPMPETKNQGGLSLFGYYCSDQQAAMKNYESYYVQGMRSLFEQQAALNKKIYNELKSLVDYSNPGKSCFSKLPSTWQEHYNTNLAPRIQQIMKALQDPYEVMNLLREAYQEAAKIRTTSAEFGGAASPASFRIPIKTVHKKAGGGASKKKKAKTTTLKPVSKKKKTIKKKK